MTARIPIPPALLTRPFLARDAREGGLSQRRLLGRDLLRPFRGVRVVQLDLTQIGQVCRARALRLRDDQFFSHVTAAKLLCIPLPLALDNDPSLHVAAFRPAAPPDAADAVGHRIEPFPHGIWMAQGVRISSPILTWCLLAQSLAEPDLIAAGDFLVSGPRPLATLPELEWAVGSWAGRPGARKLKAALPQVRVGPMSRPETLARLLIVAAGLPEPRLNINIHDSSGRFLAMGDLVWPDYRTIAECEGDYHRTDREQFRRDILRRERVEDAEWRLMRFTIDHLRHRPAEFVTRVAQRLGVRLTPGEIARAVKLASGFVP